MGKEDLSGPDNPPPDPESPPRIGPNEKQATDGNIVSIIHFTGIYAESEEIVRKEDCNGPDNSHPDLTPVTQTVYSLLVKNHIVLLMLYSCSSVSRADKETGSAKLRFRYG